MSLIAEIRSTLRRLMRSLRHVVAVADAASATQTGVGRERTMSQADEHDDWEEVWNARAAALAHALGSGHDEVYHAPHSFALGGQADVMAFDHHVQGVVYVTAELTGKPGASYADYELMICHRSDQDWGPNAISRLAPYTQEAYIAAGESMDIEGTPPESQIQAFLFDTYGTFTLFGRVNELRLCIGITKPELQFKMKHGSEKLMELLKRHGVYPFTDLERDSVPLTG
jgi:Suppressor of fused protein (SUFU)